MNKKKINYYSLDRIEKEDADFNIIFGEKGNGKSYQVKHKRALNNYLDSLKEIDNLPEYFKDGKRFMLVRRLKEEITNGKVLQYFNDVDVEKLTNGEYNCIDVYDHKIYFAKRIDYNHKERGVLIGYSIALSTEQSYSSLSFLDVSDLIVEEIFSRDRYLYREPDKLMTLYSTVDRKRHTTKIWMVGNTISRVCPYIYEWGLYEIISKMKQGEIKVVNMPSTDDDIVKVAIEYCESTGVSSHTIGSSKDMISSGEWMTNPQPHLPKSINSYKKEFRLLFWYKQMKFLGELLTDPETHDIAWFIYPYEGEIDDKTIVVSDVIKPNRYYQRDIYNISVGNDKLRNIISTTFREQNIFYATDLCGCEFKQAIDFVIRR